MIEVAQGIVRIDGKLDTNRHVIFVHPWFHGEESKKYPLSRIGKPLLGAEESDSYLLNLERLLAFKCNIFVFEEHDKKQETIARILKTGRTAGVYIIPTDRRSGLPSTLHNHDVNKPYYSPYDGDDYDGLYHRADWFNPEWDNVTKFLKKFSIDFYFAGGYSDDCGCLSEIFETLGNRGVSGKYIRGCCFQRYPN